MVSEIYYYYYYARRSWAHNWAMLKAKTVKEAREEVGSVPEITQIGKSCLLRQPPRVVMVREGGNWAHVITNYRGR